eukprot:383761_1
MKYMNQIFKATSYQRYYNNNASSVVFDYDDTLFPTTQYLIDRKRGYLINDELDYYRGVAETVINLLMATIHYFPATQIFIITNSKEGILWKCLAFYGKIINGFEQIAFILAAYNIEVISARSKYKKINTSPEKWKQTAYDKHVFADKNEKSHIITIGDQIIDHTAMTKSLIDYSYQNNKNILHHHHHQQHHHQHQNHLNLHVLVHHHHNMIHQN